MYTPVLFEGKLCQVSAEIVGVGRRRLCTFSKADETIFTKASDWAAADATAADASASVITVHDFWKHFSLALAVLVNS